MPKLELYQFQKDILNMTSKRRRVAYYLDMGLGKTLVGSEKAESLKLKTLIICQKSKINDWISHYFDQYGKNVYDLTKNANLAPFLASESNSIGVINYDLIWRRNEISKIGNFSLILDESSCIQNIKTKRTKFVLSLKPVNVILLSGTPVSGKFENLFSQARLLGWGIGLTEYNNRYVNWELINIGGNFRRIVARKNPYKNIEELKTNLRKYGAVFLKSDEVLDLPQQNFQKIKVQRTKEYECFIKERYVVVVNKELVGDTQLTNYLCRRQLCSWLNQNKIEALKDLIDSTNDRIIIFYNWNDELKALVHCIKNRPISQINGKVKDLRAYENEENSITLVQYQAGAMGLNLQKANKIIYFSPTDKSELYEQSKKRIHRIGQNNPCFYYQIIVTKSIEEQIYRALEMRKDYTDFLFKEDLKNEAV